MPLTFGAMLAQQLGSQAAGGVMGLGLGALNDNRQLKQQGRLLSQQQKFDREQMQYQNELQFDMWNKTNYSAQVEQMKKAGLNPALLYGMGGGGGTTTGQANAGVHAAAAPSGGGEIMGMLQMRTQEASIKLMEAQAEKAKAEAAKASGVDTREGQSRIDLNSVNAAIQQVEYKIKSQTAEETMLLIENSLQEQNNRLTEAVRNNSIGQALYETTIKQAQENLVQTGLQNALLKADTKLTYKKIWEISEKVAQGWKGLSIEEQNMWINRENAATNSVNANTNRMNAETGQYSAENTKSMQQFEKMIRDLKESEKMAAGAIEGILKASVISGGLKGVQPPRQEVKGFNR